MGSLFQELKRRNVFKVGVAYLVLGWLIIEIADTVFPQFEFPLWTNQFVTLLVILGFPIAVFFAWAFEVTPEGIKRESDINHDNLITQNTGRKLDFLIIGILAIALGYFVYESRFVEYSVMDDTALLADETAGIVEEEITGPSEFSIAVLPLDNLSPDPDNAYFAAGVHEEILNQLAKISAIQVTSRTTVLRYQDSELSAQDIARELSVNTILEGSVRFANNRVAITTQLIRASDDVYLWSETYERELDDIFAIQSDVAVQVANAMQATLLPAEIASIERPATESTEAYTLFLQARHQFDQEGARITLDEEGWIEASIQKMERATGLDPLFAEGFAWLGVTKRFKAWSGPFEEANKWLDEAILDSRRAIEIDSSLTRSYVTLQRVSAELRQWSDWQSYALQSVSLPDPGGAAAVNYARVLSVIGQHEEAFRWADVSITKNPINPGFWDNAIIIRIYGRDYATALSMAESFRAVGGDENAYHAIRGYIFSKQGREAESHNELNEISPQSLVIGTVDINGYRDYLRCKSGEQDSVMEELGELEIETIREARISYCAAGAGDLDTIFESFQRMMNWGRLIYYANAVSDEVKADPRWQAVEDYLNFPELN